MPKFQELLNEVARGREGRPIPLRVFPFENGRRSQRRLPVPERLSSEAAVPLGPGSSAPRERRRSF